MTIETTAWDSAALLDTPDAVAAYLDAAFADGDARVIAHALGVVARAKGIAGIARDANLTRSGLYKALSEEGDPRLTTLLGVLRSLGLTVSVRPGS
ncbi:MAG: addiction module antidote protein [Bauldia sp.]